MRPTTRLAALLLVATACTGRPAAPRSAPPVAPPAVVEAVPSLPPAEVWVRSGAARVTVASSERVERAGPIATTTVAITVRSEDVATAEATLGVRLPDGAVIGRLALEVDGRWMEGEVMPTAAAVRFYEGIVRPAVGGRRDPARLIAVGAGEWSLDVFPVPPAGERHLELVYHQVIGAAPGSVRVEAIPPSVDGGGAVFAAAASFDRAPGGAPPGRVVIALDTSLSLGKAGLAQAVAVARRLVAAHPDARVVTGDLRPLSCAGPVDACLAAARAGGATDLAALLDEAARAAGPGPAAIVLISDGRVTAGPDADAIAATLERQVGASPLAVHTVAVGRARPRVLERLAAVGLGSTDDGVVAALRGPRRPRYALRGGDLLELVDSPRGPVVLGRVATPGGPVELTRTDDLGTSRVMIDVDRAVERGFAVARVLGAQRVARSGDAQEARDWGVATAGAGLLALETEDDYAARGIARYKAVERALDLGLPPPPIADAVRASDRALAGDADGDTIPGASDLCPDEPETWNGLDDEDGCPDRGMVRIEAQELRILEHVFFAPRGAVIPARAYPIVDALAQVMRDHPEILRVAIDGHRDGRERDRTLGLRRAQAVRAALIARGVEAARLVAIDLGDRYPLRSGRTADERAYNRRVELTILATTYYTADVAGLRPEELVGLYIDAADRWRLEAARLRVALVGGERAAASAALARALAATADPRERVAVFTPDVAAAFPAEHRAAVAATARAQVLPFEADLDRFFAALVTVPHEPALTPLADTWLSTLAEPDVRLTTAPGRLTLSADVLAWLGRADEAARRRSEPQELAELARTR